MPPDAENASFCCRGCEAVHQLLVGQGLGRYYELAGNDVAAVTEPPSARSLSWLSPLVEKAEGAGEGLCALQLDVQGLHCAACVWLMNETFRREAGAAGIVVNPALGKVSLTWKRGALDPERWVRRVEAFGYQFGPSRKTPRKASTELPLRLGISVALAMNVMLFSLSFYFGLDRSDPELFGLFTWLSMALSTGVVAVGGWPFFRAALQSLRRGVLHLDLPIAAGIALVFGASVLQLTQGRGDLLYLDTLNTFICLMLAGRWVQERMLERNRRFLLEDDGAEGLVARRVVSGRLENVPATRLEAGDVLLVAPGDLVPVDAALLEPTAVVSTDWVTGESRAREVERGAVLPAGSFNAGASAFHAEAREAFADSALVTLLQQPPGRDGQLTAHQRLWDRLARIWVLAVLGLAALGLLLWWPAGPQAAVNVAAALLVVTCPCAIGIAVPLAYELVQARLRRRGFYVRSADLLDRLLRVRRALFDKTGTLTLGRLELVDPGVVAALSPQDRDAAYNLAVRSSHPVAACVARALERTGARYAPEVHAQELRGLGVEGEWGAKMYRLGRGSWAVPGSEAGTTLTRDGEVVAEFATREALRRDARKEVAALQAGGVDVWLLSGDRSARVGELAQTLGIPAERALGELTPEEKAAAVDRLGAAEALYVGDGVNDALAFSRALIAGTPAIDRPVMPGRSDFFIVGEGLGPLTEALAWAVHTRRAVRRLLIVSLGYNAVAIAASLAGLMSPLAAAVSMPASTVALLGLTAISLREGAPGQKAAGAQRAQRVEVHP